MNTTAHPHEHAMNTTARGKSALDDRPQDTVARCGRTR
jgi:hypothetical protein